MFSDIGAVQQVQLGLWNDQLWRS